MLDARPVGGGLTPGYPCRDSVPHGQKPAESTTIRGKCLMWSVRSYNGTMPLIPCGFCGERVPENPRGKRRRWCSEACRMRVYRARKRLERRPRRDG